MPTLSFDASEAPPRPPIAVIGAGFSGALAALHLARRLPPEQPVLLCERAPEFAGGAPLSRQNAGLLMNVRVNNTSLFADDPAHFDNWVSNQPEARRSAMTDCAGMKFASHGLYAAYLREQLDAAAQNEAAAPLRFLPADVIDVGQTGHGLFLQTARDQRINVAGIVLALGNPPAAEPAHPRICANSWSEKALAALDPDRPVVIAGTGLAMTDLAVTLRQNGFTGRIIAISPSGLLPARHMPAPFWPTPRLTLAESGSLLLLMRRLREEAAIAADQGIGWRAVIDSMRPITADIWARLPATERQRFLRHGRRLWDALRHRMAPPHADVIEQMLGDGTLSVHAGRIRSTDASESEVRVSFQPRGSRETQTIHAQRLIKAQELQPITRSDDPLLRTLLARRLIRFDAQGLGIDVTDELTVIGGDGRPADRIWALGPTVRGVFWECVALPDIRRQAANIAVSAVVKLRGAARF